MASESTAITVQELLAHSEWMRALARTLVGDPQTAEDLTQEALLAALRNPPRAGTPPRAWLRGTLRRLALRWWRTEAHRGEREERAAPREAIASPEELVGRVEVQRQLSDALLALREPFRHTVLLRYFEGLSSAEIARRTETPEGTVRWRLKRGLDELRGELDGRYEDRASWCAALAPLLGGLEGVGGPAGAGRPLGPPDLAGPSAVGVPAGGALATAVWPQLAGVALVVAAALVAPWGVARLLEGGRGEPAERALARAGGTPGEGAPPGRADGPPSEEDAEARAGGQRDGEGATAPGLSAVSARVVDPDGLPVRSARLAWIAPPLAATAASGGDGGLALGFEGPPPGPEAVLELELSAPGHLPRRVRARHRGERVLPLGELALTPAAALEGVVLDADGLPRAGAEVLVERLPGRDDLGDPGRLPLREWSYLGSMLPPEAERARTDAGGRYRFETLPVGFVRVWARAEERFAAYTEPLGLRSGAVGRAPALRLIAAQPGELVTGRVVDPEGRAVPGARVRAWRASRPELGFEHDHRTYRATADEHGRFRLAVNPNPELELAARDPQETWRPSAPVRVRGGARDLRVELRAPATITVDVRYARGEAPAELSLEVRDAPSGARVARVEWSDALADPPRIERPARPFVVEVTAPGAAPQVVGPLDPRAVGDELRAELRPARRLRGRVQGPDGPLPGVAVELLRALPDDRWRAVEGLTTDGRAVACRVARDGLLGSAESDAQGRFELELPGRGPFLVRAAVAGWAPVELDGALPDELELRARAGGTLAGTVATDPGRHPAGALVAVTAGDGRLRTRRVGSDGRFRFEGLAPGGYQVLQLARELDAVEERELLLRDARPQERERRTAIEWDVQVVAGETAHVVLDRREAARCTLAGELALDGEPPGPWRVELRPAGAGARAEPLVAYLDPRGRFRVELPAPGPYRLETWRPGYRRPRVVLSDEVEVAAGRTAWRAALDTAQLLFDGDHPLGDPPRAARYEWRGAGALRCAVELRAEDLARVDRLRLPAGPARVTFHASEGAAARDSGQELALDLPAGGSVPFPRL